MTGYALRFSAWAGTLTLGCSLMFAGCERPSPPALRTNAADVAALKKAFGGEEEAAVAEPQAAAEPTGWATIRGTFIIDGPAPERQTLDVNKEQNICMPGGKPVLAEGIVVDPATGGIKDVVIWLNQKIPTDDPKWIHESYAATADAAVPFDQKNCIFLTHVVAIRSTQTLEILNSDPIGHNTNIAGGGGASPFNQTISAHGKVPYQPGGESASPFSVTCSIHPWMAAHMLVRNNPYFAVTKPDGSFEIANVPAGVPLEFRVWQERSGFVQTVNLNGSPAKWSKGKYEVTLQPDETQELKVTVDASAFSK